MKRFGIVFLATVISFALLFCACNLSYAETNITFVWNIVQVEDLAGFKLFQREEGQNYDYSAPVATINDPNVREYILNDVPDGKNLYWIMRAFDNNFLESGNSNEVNQSNTGVPPIPSALGIKVVVDVKIIP